MTKRQHMGLASLFKTFIPTYCLTLTSTNIDRGVFGQREAKSLRMQFDNKIKPIVAGVLATAIALTDLLRVNSQLS